MRFSLAGVAFAQIVEDGSQGIDLTFLLKNTSELLY